MLPVKIQTPLHATSYHIKRLNGCSTRFILSKQIVVLMCNERTVNTFSIFWNWQKHMERFSNDTTSKINNGVINRKSLKQTLFIVFDGNLGRHQLQGDNNR